jgi:capsular exopolysaccharide synthesis family protein
LQEAWGGGVKLPLDIAFKRLKSELGVRRYRDTSLIEITVYDHDGGRAAEIANTTADVFEQDRLELKKQQTQKGIDKLRDDVTQQTERVRIAQEEVERLRRVLEVPVVGKEVKLSDLTLEQMQGKLTEARGDVRALEAKVNEVKKLTPQQLRGALSTLTADSTIQGLLKDLTDTETRLETIKQELGPEHPTVLALIAQHDKLQDQLDQSLEGMKSGFDVEYKVAKARADELQQDVDAAKAASYVLESEKYLPFRNAQRAEELETRLEDALKARIQQAIVEMDLPRSPVEVLDRAEPPLPQMYVSPKMWVNVPMGAAAGLLLGVALAFFIEFLDTSIKRIEDVEKYLGLPILGVIGPQAGLLSRGDMSMAHLEAYRMLRTNIEFAKPEGKATSLCIVSAGAGEGKSFTIANLAFVYAQHGARVLVVDSDLRRPRVHEHLGVSNTIGLADYLAGKKQVQEIIQPTSNPRLSIIAACGGSSAREVLPLLTSRRMAELIEQVGRQFDVVLYDTPPILGVSDAAIVAREVGMSVLVVQHRRYPRNMARRAVQVVQNAGGKLLGCVVNNVQLGHDETYYYYHDQLEHYQHTIARDQKAIAAAKPAASDEIDLSGKY